MSGDDRSVMLIGQRLLVFPGSWHEGMATCVAEDSPRKRCRREIYTGCPLWVPVSIRDLGEVSAGKLFVDPWGRSGWSEDPQPFIQQRCREHYGSAAVDAVSAEWELFDPTVHADLIRPFQFEWTENGVVSGVASRSGRSEPDVELPEVPTMGIVAEVPGTTALYRWADGDDRALYTGITDTLVARQTRHAKRSSWAEFAATCKIERFATRAEAERAERDAIRAEQPLFNAAHNDTPEARQRLVAYLVEKGRLDLLVPNVERG